MSEIVEKSAPVNDDRDVDQRAARRGRRPARGPAREEGRPDRRRRPRRGPLPRRGRRRDSGASRRARRSRRRGSARSTRKGTLTLARLGREAPIAAGNPAGPALRDVERGSLAARLLYPEIRQTRPGGAAAVARDRHRRARSVRAAGRHRGAAQAAPRARWLERKEPVQTPAAFEYERATSVEGAIASLQRLGSEARVIAGGHSLLPMMKLRLANAAAPDRHQRPRRALLHPRGGRRDPDRRADPARRAVRSPTLLARHFPLFRDAEDVIADPVVRNRGTIGGSLCQADAAEDLSAVCSAVKAQAVIRGTERRARRRDGGLPRRAVHDRRRRRRAAHRDPGAAAAGRRQRAREGRAPRRRLGDRRRIGGRLDRGRDDRRRGHRAQRGRAHDDPRHASRGAAARQGSVGGALRTGGRDRLGGLHADRGRPRARSTTSAISPASSRNAPCSRAAARAADQEA